MSVTNRKQRLVQGLDGVKTAAEVLRSGGLAAFPTETVYGLGADATNDTAVAKIYEMTNFLSSFNPENDNEKFAFRDSLKILIRI